MGMQRGEFCDPQTAVIVMKIIPVFAPGHCSTSHQEVLQLTQCSFTLQHQAFRCIYQHSENHLLAFLERKAPLQIHIR